jgi:hypothetical protein
MDYFVTNGDLLAIFKNCRIVKYAGLDNYDNIYMLLPNRMDFCFILTESELNSGHWTILIRDDDVFEYFDSYGTSPKNILEYIPNHINSKISAWCPGRFPRLRPMPAAVASRCCRSRFQQLAYACSTTG